MSIVRRPWWNNYKERESCACKASPQSNVDALFNEADDECHNLINYLAIIVKEFRFRETYAEERQEACTDDFCFLLALEILGLISSLN